MQIKEASGPYALIMLQLPQCTREQRKELFEELRKEFEGDAALCVPKGVASDAFHQFRSVFVAFCLGKNLKVSDHLVTNYLRKKAIRDAVTEFLKMVDELCNASKLRRIVVLNGLLNLSFKSFRGMPNRPLTTYSLLLQLGRIRDILNDQFPEYTMPMLGIALKSLERVEA